MQWSPALIYTRLIQTPRFYGQFRWSGQKLHTFSLKLTCLIQTPVNNTFSCRVTNFYTFVNPALRKLFICALKKLDPGRNIGTQSVQELFFQFMGRVGVKLGDCPVGMVYVMGWAICVWRPTESLFCTKFARKHNNFYEHFDTSELFYSIRKFSSFNWKTRTNLIIKMSQNGMSLFCLKRLFCC